ncbi:Zn-dependent hydrolase [Micromonospora aurantiaca]|uniref:Zn-dependent hydrolase n=1 Tax=Micromonospora aurantiaca (nom. illeg.) TaxID=47850 RepID=UPI0033AD8ED3
MSYPERVDVLGPDGTPLDCTADPGRLMEYIEEFAQLTSTAGGITRLAYTQMERAAHEIYGKRMRELGLTVWTDAAGNTIAERPGRTAGIGAIGTGSHLDSVPGAGRFDGIAGVAAALEAARLAVEHDLPHRRPMRFVAFAAEEGARFGQACLGSRFAAGLIDEHHLTSVRDYDGVTLAEAMRSVGLDPTRAARTPWPAAEWSAFVELHVEQGGVLEEAGLRVGVVDLVSGSTRLQLRIVGQASHTGATPMHLRQDALTAAAEIVLIAETLATDAQHRGTRATVGRLDVSPGSITTIAGGVTFSLEVRDVDSDRQRSTATEIVRRARAVCDRRRVGLEVSLLGDTSPVVLPMWLRLITAQACRSSGVSYRVMTSGASHDAQIIGRLTPASILFVPSRGGLSHVPEEWTSSSDLARGTSVLLTTLLRTDAELDRINALDSQNARGPAADDLSASDDGKGQS